MDIVLYVFWSNKSGFAWTPSSNIDTTLYQVAGRHNIQLTKQCRHYSVLGSWWVTHTTAGISNDLQEM